MPDGMESGWSWMKTSPFCQSRITSYNVCYTKLLRNQYVTAAKQYATTLGVTIDLPAGPSEVLIMADESSVPEFIAADLLSQAEHGVDSQVILCSTSQTLLVITSYSIHYTKLYEFIPLA